LAKIGPEICKKKFLLYFFSWFGGGWLAAYFFLQRPKFSAQHINKKREGSGYVPRTTMNPDPGGQKTCGSCGSGSGFGSPTQIQYKLKKQQHFRSVGGFAEDVVLAIDSEKMDT
jgi:hypothetical protein